MTTEAEKQPPTAEELGAALLPKQRAFVEAFLQNFTVAAAGRQAGYSDKASAHRVYKRLDVQAYIQARMSEACMPANEVLGRLSAYARVTGDQFTCEEEYEVPVYEARPLAEQMARLQNRVEQMLRIDPELLKGKIESLNAQIAELEVELAENPDATYQKQVGSKTRTRIVPSLEAAAENGVLFALESIEYGQHGLKWKRVSSVEALTLIGKHHKLFTERTEHSGSVDLGVKYIAGLTEDDL
ncbi:terminase small subunit [Deinococcus phoenicis]|uniref:Terminase small subunit n=1 Tax=Deinococcus phoenicis TaxID=1476583 RepID=A0A016QLY3_9DEIO|nr:terminase small subunit [Deinococcus phoenicis]EYB67033.1 terminase small subunit [Deinococcus phoenicis]